MPNVENLKFIISDIALTAFRCNPAPPEYDGQAIPLNFNTKCTTGVAQDYSHVRIIIAVTVSPLNDPDTELVFLECEMIFPALGIEEWVSDGKIELPDALWHTIISMAVGTTRGLLVAQTGSSIYGKIILPITDSKALIPKDNFDVKNAKKRPTSYSHLPSIEPKPLS
jgi:hypothetical protein